MSLRRLREPGLLALTAIILVLVHTGLSFAALSPDGVSYLDLARMAASGDWPAFVQGYWSPLYPAVIALISKAASQDSVVLVGIAHGLNGAAAVGAILLLWHWGRRWSPLFLRLLLVTFLLISAGLPRIEGVTPDVLLLACMAWIGYELLPNEGRRPLLIGLLLGGAYLVKTSCWPWLLAAIPVRWWGAAGPAERRGVLVSSVVSLGVMLLWVVPMSVRAGHVTLGSAGRLNYQWYIDASDSRAPDFHGGAHALYRSTVVDTTHQVDWADFPGADRWTYQPWSDPTAWDAGVQSRTASPPNAIDLIAYWGRQAGRSLALWLSPALLGALVPAFLIYRAPNARRAFMADRSTAAVAILGVIGIAQFVAVHAEPRLIAPFGLLFSLALLHGLAKRAPATSRYSHATVQMLSWVGAAVLIAFAIPRLRDGAAFREHSRTMITTLANYRAQLSAAGMSPDRVVVLGPVLPVEASAFMAGVHIAAQVLPRSLPALASLPQQAQLATMQVLFASKAPVAWVTGPQGDFRVVVIRR